MKNFRLLREYLRGSGKTYILTLTAVLLMTVFSSMTPLVIAFTVDSVIGGKPVDPPAFLESRIDAESAVAYIRNNLWIILLVLVSITLLQGVFLFLRGKYSAVSAQVSSKRMREKLYDHLQHLPFDYHVKAQTGDLIQRCTSDIETVQNFIASQSVDALQIIAQVIVVLSIMISMSLRYTLISIALVPIVFVITVRFFINMMKVFIRSDEAEGHMTTTLQENLTGVRVVKAFGAQNFEMEKFDEKNRTFRDLSMKIIRLMANFWSGTDLLCMLQHALVIAVGAYWVVKDQVTIGTVVAFSSYTGMLVWPLRNLGQMMGFMGQAFVSLGRLQEILDNKPEDYTTGSRPPVEGEIVFDNVSFEYEKGKPVLEGISFRIEKGSTVAILGGTGSGKSSLVHLLLRLYDYTSGSIRIDGTELKDISREWIRKNIGIVLQEPFLFSRSIRENIRMGAGQLSDEQILAVARVACVDQDIQEFENGYDTIVGERGVTLSGGQRQRVAIARTIARSVPILIFDDSLSAVDTETDAQIRQALKERRKNTTTIIISHRITTLSEADRILVLDRGRIVQTGTHEELINVEGPYRRIWEIQSTLGEEAV
ncbi:MAG TPA: ABC transporter ATP-binding protein [Thermoclostridium sp.]|nr:ABC transporter ATP-binding protein [Thermoclostridium sp.]HPU45221.1 ABC transporter ATP-binding protein [Thermoclostridium sp.]